MPRPHKPTTLRLLDGTHRNDRHGPKEEAIVVKEPLCLPPEDWADEAKETWRNVVDQIPHGVATKADTLIVEILVRLVGRVRFEPELLTPALAAQIRACCNELGMTPSARARLSVGADKPPKSKFHGLIGRVSE